MHPGLPTALSKDFCLKKKRIKINKYGKHEKKFCVDSVGVCRLIYEQIKGINVFFL